MAACHGRDSREVPVTETGDLATQTVSVKLTPRQVETIHLTDEPVSTWIREAVEQRLAREIPSYGKA